jgi:hypothetical protein
MKGEKMKSSTEKILATLIELYAKQSGVKVTFTIEGVKK